MAEWSGAFDLQGLGIEDDGTREDGFVPDIDLDGDGTLDTMVLEGLSRQHDQLTVLTDLDGDGDADRATVFEGDGDYTVWVSSADLVDGPDGSWRAAERGSL